VYEPRAGQENAVKWPNDTVRTRFRALERVSRQIHAVEGAKGIHQHRDPHPGFAFDAALWASGRPLSDIIDPDLTPGDFVRTIRQMIDLLRQLETIAPDEALRDTARAAGESLNRGVVSLAVGSGPA
jgi:ATP-dependent RNA helicase HelY